MTIYTKKEWREKCGLLPPHLTEYIKKGKVKLNEQSLIDDELPLNADFLAKRKEILLDKSKELENNAALSPDKNNKSTKSEGDYETLDRRIKKQDLLKKEAETRLLNLKEEKIKGEHIPTELVKGIVMQMSQSFVTAFKNSMEDFITNIAKEKGLTVNDISNYRGKLVNVINLASENSVKLAKKNIKSLVDEYSEKRGVGEHD
jgi:hypothetical protein